MSSSTTPSKYPAVWTRKHLRAFLAENWEGICLGGEYGHLVLCGDVTVAVAHFGNEDSLTGVSPFPFRPNNWHWGEQGIRAAIDKAVEAQIFHHKASLKQLIAARRETAVDDSQSPVPPTPVPVSEEEIR